MYDADRRPVCGKILGHQAAMAAVRLGLAAQQNGGKLKQRTIQLRLDLACPQQLKEALLVRRPIAAAFPVLVEHLLLGCEQRLVEVVGAAQLPQKEWQILLLGEAGELRGVVQPHVDQALYSGSS